MSFIKKTPVFDFYEKYSGKIVEFAGYSMPIQFSNLTDEHKAVRESAGIFDVSHMGEVVISGKDASKFINYLVTNDVNELIDCKILYTMMCYENGTVVDDLLVYRMSEDYFWLVINASNTQKDYEWILANKGDFDVKINNISDDIGQLAIQGPFAERILQKFTDTDLSQIKFFHLLQNVMILGKVCVVSRTGYTGEDGFEIYCSSNDVGYLFDKILEDGKFESVKVKPIGLGARDTLRFEANLPLYGNELSDKIPATESMYNFCIKLNKENFIGKEALVLSKANLKRKLVGFQLLENGVPRHGYEVMKEDKIIGFVTTGYISPTVNKPIGLAYVDIEYANLSEQIFIIIRNKKIKASIISRKFLQK